MRKLKKAKPVFKLLKRISVITLHAIKMALLLFVIGFCLLLWRLSVSPVNVTSMLPTVVSVIVPKGLNIDARASSVFLRLQFQEKGLFRISAQNVEVFHKDGVVLSVVPTVEIAYGLKNLLTLNYYPEQVFISSATFQLTKDSDGFWFNQSTSVPVEQPMVKAKKLDRSVTHSIVGTVFKFDTVRLKDCSLLIDDRIKNKKVNFPKIDITMERTKKDNYTLDVFATVKAKENTADLTGNFVLNRKTKKLTFKAQTTPLKISSFSEVSPWLSAAHFSAFAAIDGEIDLTEVKNDKPAKLTKFNFKLETNTSGTFSLPEPFSNVYPFKHMLIMGAFDWQKDLLVLKDSSIQLEQGNILNISASLSGLNKYIKSQNADFLETILHVSTKEVLVEQVPTVWPPTLGAPAYDWVKANVKKGNISNAVFDMTLKGTELVNISSIIDVNSATITFLDGMPDLEDVAGKIAIHENSVDITQVTGHVGDLKVTEGGVYFSDIQADIPLFKTEFTATGTVPNALSFLRKEPLQLKQDIDINPKETAGEVTAKTLLQFPLKDDLSATEIQVQAQAMVKDGLFPISVDKMKLSNADLIIDVNNKGLEITGTGNVQNLPITLKKTEPFKTAKPSTLHLSANWNSAQLKKVFADTERYLIGNVKIAADILQNNADEYDITATADLTEANVTEYVTNYTKATGKPLKATIKTNIKPKKLSPIFIDMNGKDLMVKGNFQWGKTIGVVIDTFKTPKTAFSGKFSYTPKKELTADIKGEKWDLSKIKELNTAKPTKQIKDDIPNVQKQPIALDINVSLNTLKLEKNISGVTVQLKRNGYLWENLLVELTANKPFQLQYFPSGRKLQGYTEDVGSLLEAVGAGSKVEGGKIQISAKQGIYGGLKGKVKGRQLSLKDPGFLTQALTILGILDAIRGKSLDFDSLDIPFEVTPHQTFFINEAVIKGNSLGITFSGRISFNALDIKGEVIPAYMINSLLGKIPVVGNLFKSSQGGGLVAVTYTINGPLTAPEVSVNPLSAIAPGILGKFF